tara:strand:- start:146 stop:304 length:159 start_codon:yes stop_codon:yes gene_type:complete
MSYKIEDGNNTYTVRSKDDVIAQLLALYSNATMEPIKVTWPDGGVIEYEGEE